MTIDDFRLLIFELPKRRETFDYIGDDPTTAPLLKMMRGADGKPAVAENAWISYLTGHHEGNANGEGTGKLTAGYGARGSSPDPYTQIHPGPNGGVAEEIFLKINLYMLDTGV